MPGILEDLHEQFLLPPLHAGWHVRRKSQHFKAYEEVAKRFGKLLGMDPWLINPLFNSCGEVNFAEGTGMECLQTNVDALLDPGKIRRKYKEYGINEALRGGQGRQRHLRHGDHDGARRQGARGA